MIGPGGPIDMVSSHWQVAIIGSLSSFRRWPLPASDCHGDGGTAGAAGTAARGRRATGSTASDDPSLAGDSESAPAGDHPITWILVFIITCHTVRGSL
jgi:hypothetical protein